MPTTSHVQMKDFAAVKSLTVPAGAFGAEIQCVHQSEGTGTAVSGMRYTLDGDDPTEDIGMLIPANGSVKIESNRLLRAAKFIRGSAAEDPRLEVSYYIGDAP